MASNKVQLLCHCASVHFQLLCASKVHISPKTFYFHPVILSTLILMPSTSCISPAGTLPLKSSIFFFLLLPRDLCVAMLTKSAAVQLRRLYFSLTWVQFWINTFYFDSRCFFISVFYFYLSKLVALLCWQGDERSDSSNPMLEKHLQQPLRCFSVGFEFALVVFFGLVFFAASQMINRYILSRFVLK